MIEEIYEPPIDTAWFQRELDAACRDTHCELRIVWAPRQVVARVVDRNGSIKEYKKYPVLFGSFMPYVRGRYYCRLVGEKMTTIAYQKVSDGVIPACVKMTDIALPDIVRVNPSIHIFVIERRLPDEAAKRIHEEKRRLAKSQLGFDLFGDFPHEGVWDWFDDISEHRGVQQGGVEVPCCEIAAAHGVRCQGLYREPNHEDLERVRLALKRWLETLNLEDKTPLIEQGARDITGAIREYEDKELTSILIEARECENLDKLAHERTRVAIGVNPPIHRTPY
jgi:hypothetical protein